MNILVDEYTQGKDVIRNLVDMSAKDYTTALHSVNVMALVFLKRITQDHPP